ncbi:MAG: hypothetical protein M3261_02460, partial [Thermoproteota archaeon]|nr:hypothetical protein [Thermoproteota archaeon]
MSKDSNELIGSVNLIGKDSVCCPSLGGMRFSKHTYDDTKNFKIPVIDYEAPEKLEMLNSGKS